MKTVFVNLFSSSRSQHPDIEFVVWSAAIVTRGAALFAVAGIRKDVRKDIRKGAREGVRKGVCKGVCKRCSKNAFIKSSNH